MTIIGFHASHEQIDPRTLLRDVKHAEQAGFEAAMCSDHFAPWSNAQGESGFSWSWLGAALEATSLTFGVVTAPGQRFHPALVAQAAATLAQMYPDRFWLALGSGEALNEHITGERWPSPPERNARLEECAQVIRDLFDGEEVSRRGLVVVDRARLYTRPARPPLLLGAALLPETAHWMGGWADGLITVNQSVSLLRQVLERYREGGGGRKKTALQVHVSYAGTEDEALATAMDQWAPLVVGAPLAFDIDMPERFEQIARLVRPEDVREAVLISSDTGRFVGWLQELAGLGFDELYLHHVGKDQSRFIDVFGDRVLPALRH